MALGFINQLDDTAGKIKYQKATVKIGIETFKVIVPFSNFDMFETELKEALDNVSMFKNRKLFELVKKFNGQIEE